MAKKFWCLPFNHNTKQLYLMKYTTFLLTTSSHYLTLSNEKKSHCLPEIRCKNGINYINQLLCYINVINYFRVNSWNLLLITLTVIFLIDVSIRTWKENGLGAYPQSSVRFFCNSVATHINQWLNLAYSIHLGMCY